MENSETNMNDEIKNEEIKDTASAETAQDTEALPLDVKEDTGNLDVCPNCLEPNTDNLAVCKYCGMPLHQGADPDEYTMQTESADLEANRAEAAPEEKKPPKKQENGFRRVMPWLGLYLIYYAVTGCIDINRQIKQAAEEGQTVNVPLAYGAQAIWFIAGVMMAWPLIKKGYRKLRGLPEPEEVEETGEKTDIAPEESSENNITDDDEIIATQETTVVTDEETDPGSAPEDADGSTEG